MSPPALSEAEEQLIVRERLRLLAIGFYVKGSVCAIFVSFLIFHLIFMLTFSFMPESAWKPPPKSMTNAPTVSVTPSPSARAVNQGPPVILFRIFATVIGVIILLGWTFGGLTIYAGRCVRNRTERLFILIMAGLNCAQCRTSGRVSTGG